MAKDEEIELIEMSPESVARMKEMLDMWNRAIDEELKKNSALVLGTVDPTRPPGSSTSIHATIREDLLRGRRW